MISTQATDSGIYTITNNVNGKQYVGSAKNFRMRCNAHRSALKRGEHHSPKLQRAFNKYGEESFTFAPMLICEKGMVKFYEQRALDILKPYITGYNCSTGAETYEREHNTTEHNRKISESHKGMKYPEERCEKQRKLMFALNLGKKYTLYGETLSVHQWAVKYGLTYNKLQHRIRYLGSLQAALENPATAKDEVLRVGREAYRETHKTIPCLGTVHDKSSLARALGINRKRFYYWEKKLGSLPRAVEYLIKKYGGTHE